MFAAEETLSNTFDFLHKLVRMKDPQELAQLQSEFVSRLPRDNQDERPATIRMRMAPGVG
jgi:hypothetical protein